METRAILDIASSEGLISMVHKSKLSSANEVLNNLKQDKKMATAAEDVLATADKYKVNPRTGAYIISVKRVADAMKARGWY